MLQNKYIERTLLGTRKTPAGDEVMVYSDREITKEEYEQLKDESKCPCSESPQP